MKFLVLSLLFMGCSQVTTSNNKTLISDYKSNANELVQLNKANGSKEKINKMSLQLTAQAKPIMTQYKQKHPECSELIDFVIGSASKMTKLSLKEIETQFHAGEALPKSPDDCYDIKELIVHPATVTILTSKKSLTKEMRTQINDEIEEVLAHIDAI